MRTDREKTNGIFTYPFIHNPNIISDGKSRFSLEVFMKFMVLKSCVVGISTEPADAVVHSAPKSRGLPEQFFEIFLIPAGVSDF